MSAIQLIERKRIQAEQTVMYYLNKVKYEGGERYISVIREAQSQIVIYENLLREINEELECKN